MIASRFLRPLVAALVLCAAPALAQAEAPAGAGAAPAVEAANQAATEAQAAGAIAAIEALHETLLGVMKDGGYDGRFARLSDELPKTYDIGFMARMSVGRRQWKKLSEAEQQRWLSIFGRLLAANYAGRFKGFSGHEFHTLGNEPASKSTLLVRTKLIVPGDEDVFLNYRMRADDGEWRIIDVFLNGTVSEIALRRSEYASVLKRDGFEKLVSTLQGKIEKLKRDGNS